MKTKELLPVFFTNLLFLLVLLSSCSDNDQKVNIGNGTRMLTFSVREGFDETSNESSRGLEETPDTTYQRLKDGTILDAVVEWDKIADSRAAEPIAAGTKVLAIVIDAMNNVVYRIHELTVDDNGQLSCEVPDTYVRVIFYSYNSLYEMPTTTLEAGDWAFLETKNNTENFMRDVMRFETGTIGPDDTELGVILFKHLFTRVRVRMYYSTGLFSFNPSLTECSSVYAEVDILSGRMEPIVPEIYVSMGMSGAVSQGSQMILDSNYSIFIPRNDVTEYDLHIAEINDDLMTNKHMRILKAFRPGYSYTIHLRMRKNIIWGWTSDYYRWDAVEPFEPGSTPFSGTSGSASHSCQFAPSPEEIQRILGSGVFWDDKGPEWIGYDGRVYTTGLWVLKKRMWGQAKSVSVTPEEATDQQRNSEDYIFLPAAGMIPLGQNCICPIAVGENGNYWANTLSNQEGSDNPAYALHFTPEKAELSEYSRYHGFSLWQFLE